MQTRHCVLLAALWWSACVAGGGAADGEYLIKSGCLYNFAQFIEWPAEAFTSEDAPFVLGIYGSNPFGVGIFAMELRQIRGHPIQVTEIPDDGRALPDCHMLFVPASHRKSAPQLISSLSGRAVALVGEDPAFAREGGMINFFIDNDRVAFEVNVQAAQSAGLTISSRLLKLARIVE